MLPPVIGLSKHKFKINNDNTFRVYGENFDDTSVTLKAKLESTSFDWDPPELNLADSDRKKHYVVLKSKPNLKAAPAPARHGAAAPVQAPGAPGFADIDDDITITLTFDEGGPQDTSISEDYSVTFE